MGELADVVGDALIHRNEVLEARLRTIGEWAVIDGHHPYVRQRRRRCQRCGKIWPCPVERIRAIAAGES